MFYNQLKVIIKKDVLELLKDKGLIFSLVIVPIIFSMLLPILIFLVGTRKEVMASISGIKVFLDSFKILSYPSFITEKTLPLYAVFTYFFLPFFMLIPVMISTVLSSNSLIGEKEKKTLEGLLYTPISVRNLILGKALASAIPAVILTWFSIIIYTVIVNSLGWNYFGHIILPNITWILVTLFISPLLVMVSILLVIGSSQFIKTSKSSQGIAMIIITPIIGIFISQSTGVLILGLFESLILVIILLILNLIVFTLVVKQFNFEKFILNN